VRWEGSRAAAGNIAGVTLLVVDDAEVAAIAAAISSAPLVAFDLEFLSADRLVPTLCLIQVAWLPGHETLDALAAPNVPAEGPGSTGAGLAAPSAPTIALIDPLNVDARPVIEAIAAHACVVAHAARQDLQLLATRFGIAISSLADTQVMAAFAGIGDQIGFASLANQLLGTTLGKEQQWTDWAARPLSAAQLTYADADVRHLPAIYAKLAALLGGRLAWARIESAVVASDALAAAQVTPETAWRQISVRGFEPDAMAAMTVLAAWRHRVAIELDRPLGQVLNEKVLLDLARQRPDSPEGVRAMKGISPLARQRAVEITEAIATAPQVDVPARAIWRAASTRAQRWADVLIAIVQLAAEQSGVAARLLATRADAEEFARIVDEVGIEGVQSLPALTSWRHEVLGKLWIGWLSGTMVLVGDANAPSGLMMLPR